MERFLGYSLINSPKLLREFVILHVRLAIWAVILSEGTVGGENMAFCALIEFLLLIDKKPSTEAGLLKTRQLNGKGC